MKGLGKVHPPDAQVLKDIWLSFLPGAKIGVLGLNGCRQELAAEDHGGRRHGVHRRGVSRRRHHGRLPAPGAAARPQEDGQGERRGRRGRDQGHPRPLRRAEHEARRGSVARGDGQGARRAGPPAGPHRRRSTPGRSTRSSSWRWTRCAARRPTPTSRRSPAASAAASRCAGCCSSRPTCCCSTSRPTTSTPSRWRGSSASSRNTRAPSSPSRTTATSSTTPPSGSSSSIAGTGIPWKGNYSSWLDQKQQRLAQEEKTETKRQKTLQRELELIRMSPRARQAKGKARLNAYEQLLNEDTAQKIEQVEIYIPPGPAARRRRRRGARRAQGLRRPAADGRPVLHAAARRHRRRDRARTAPARRRCSA